MVKSTSSTLAMRTSSLLMVQVPRVSRHNNGPDDAVRYDSHDNTNLVNEGRNAMHNDDRIHILPLFAMKTLFQRRRFYYFVLTVTYTSCIRSPLLPRCLCLVPSGGQPIPIPRLSGSLVRL